MEMSFETLKASLVSAPILGFPYFRGAKAGRFILDTDFCAQQIAGVLSQDQEGREVIIGYGSKKLNKSQSRWPSTKGELYADIFYMKKYQYYLQYEEQFLWRTDNSALRAIHTMDCPGAIVERWLGTLTDFNIEVQHRAGAKHGNTDGLSRSGYAEGEISATHIAALHAIGPKAETEARLMVARLEVEAGQRLRSDQEEDPELRMVQKWLVDGHPPDKLATKGLSRIGWIYAGMYGNLSLDDQGVICLTLDQTGLTGKRSVPCLPHSEWDEAIRVAHVQGGHMGRDITLARLATRVFFPPVHEGRGGRPHRGLPHLPDEAGERGRPTAHPPLRAVGVPLPADPYRPRGAPQQGGSHGGLQHPHRPGRLYQMGGSHPPDSYHHPGSC